MTNISKRNLTAEQTSALFSQLASLFAKKSESSTGRILRELLGEEEQIMLAKRFVAVLLIHRKQTPYSIARSLNLSQTTVGKLLEQYDSGKYQHIVKSISKPTPEVVRLLETIDSILHLGGILPHYGQTHRSEKIRKNQH